MRANFDNLTIGALAAEADVHGETIRFYQRKGLLRQPQRQLGSVRRYGQADLGRLRFIKTAQKLGFSLEEIGQLLQLEDGTHCQQARELAQHKLRAVRTKLADLACIESALADVVERCEAVQGDICCPLIATLLDAGGAAK
jgi:MerR family transcriptional regulator, mercuric resistance operon regulatory protein